MIAKVVKVLTTFQDEILKELSLYNQQDFYEDEWRDDRGWGKSVIVENGKHLERAGINFSCISGEKLPPAASDRLKTNSSFQAVGISLVVHPSNPFAPTAHANMRFFLAEDVWWFGGGYDLTPCYGFDDDCKHWHKTAKSACDKFNPSWYQEFKENCDDYFFLRHRQEPRGIGGIFFDDFNRVSFEESIDFIQAVGKSFLQAYMPILYKRRDTEHTNIHKDFQQFRRSRYVEFNLVQDRGTLFGLQYGGRVESILVSMPLHASWRYKHHPEKGSAEEELYTKYLQPRDWTND